MPSRRRSSAFCSSTSAISLACSVISSSLLASSSSLPANWSRCIPSSVSCEAISSSLSASTWRRRAFTARRSDTSRDHPRVPGEDQADPTPQVKTHPEWTQLAEVSAPSDGNAIIFGPVDNPYLRYDCDFVSAKEGDTAGALAMNALDDA